MIHVSPMYLITDISLYLRPLNLGKWSFKKVFGPSFLLYLYYIKYSSLGNVMLVCVLAIFNEGAYLTFKSIFHKALKHGIIAF